MAKRRRKRRGKRRAQRGFLRPYLGIIGLILAGALAFGGFLAWTATRPEVGETQAAVCVLVIDRTASSSGSLTVERYRNLGYKAVDGCAERRASLAVYAFDPLNKKLNLVDDKVFDLWVPITQKEALGELEQEEAVDEAKLAVDKAIDLDLSGSSGGSNIIAALSGAAENVRNEANADNVQDRYLIMLTDGYQISPDLSVESLSTETAPVVPLVDKAGELGLIPSELEGTDVNLVGVRSGVTPEGDALPDFFEDKVEEFWGEVVKRGGGNLCTYVVDSQSLPVSC